MTTRCGSPSGCWRPESKAHDCLTRSVLGMCLLVLMSYPALPGSLTSRRTDAAVDPTVLHTRTIRTVQIDMGLIWFHPSAVTVKAGETVRFVLRNTTEHVPHEFTIGSPNMQLGRRELIKEMSQATPIEARIHNSSPYDAPNAVVVLPGETKELIWTFTNTQRFEFGCNVPGHYEFGMKGTFRLLLAGDNEFDFPAVGRQRQEPGRPAADLDPAMESSTPATSPPGHDHARTAARDTAPANGTNAYAHVSTDQSALDGPKNALAQVGKATLGVTPVNAAPSGTPRADENAAEGKRQETADPARQLGAGHELMARGNVLRARELYTLSLEAGLSEAALALGRSYDPRAIAKLDMPDAVPDLDQARKWYEEWYRRSVEQGTISPDVRLEWLLKAMVGQ